MTRTELTIEEERQLLLLLEGDISDIDMEESDDENNYRVTDPPGPLVDHHTDPPITSTNIGIAYEVDEKDSESEDDLPLAHFQKNRSEIHVQYLWKNFI
nr:uncharacterized protein LOC111515061 isoform X2 [Leptinotarsa decemlineata]